LETKEVGTGKRGIPYMETVNENNFRYYSSSPRPDNNKRDFLGNATRTVLSSFDTMDFPHV
jgi:hypothetical protein